MFQPRGRVDPDRDPPVRAHGRGPDPRRRVGGEARRRSMPDTCTAVLRRRCAAVRVLAAPAPAPGPDQRGSTTRRLEVDAAVPGDAGHSWRPGVRWRRCGSRSARGVVHRRGLRVSSYSPHAFTRRARGDADADRGAARLGGRALADLGRSSAGVASVSTSSSRCSARSPSRSDVRADLRAALGGDQPISARPA